MPTRSPAVVVWALLAVGCAATAPAELSLNRDHLDFGDVEVGGTYRLAVALLNLGGVALSVNEVRLDPPSPDVELEGLPIAEIGMGNRKVLTVVYRPTSEGTLSAVVHVNAADGKGPREVPLAGRAVRLSAVVRAEPPGASCPGVAGSLDFGTVSNGTAGVRQLTVESTGSGTIAMLKATLSPEDAGFTVEGLADGLSLPPGQSSTLTVRYDPTRAGPQTGAITLETNSFVLPRLEIPICGTGLVSALCATPALLSLGDVAPGVSGRGQLTVSSCGNLPLTLQTARIVPDPTAAAGFSLTPAPLLPLALDPGQSTVIEVRFDATSTLTARSQVRLTSSSPVTPELLVAVGANLPPPCNATLGPSSLHFYKDLASTQSLRLTNNGAADCVIERLDLVPAGSDFFLERALQLPAVLSARSSMELTVSYAPPSTARSTTSATLQLELDWVHEVSLRGDPRPPSGCHLVPKSRVVDFGLISASGPVSHNLPLTNVGTDQCVIHGITFDQPGFTAFFPSMVIGAQSQVSLSISWTPAPGVNPLAATMTISSDDRDQPQLAVPVITGHLRCDPNCACTPAQTPTYWRFTDQQYVPSSVTPSSGGLGALQESCDPKRCADHQVALEIDRGVLQCASEPSDCAAGLGLEYQGDGWACVPCALVVQYGGLYGGQRACAPLPTMSCASGLTATFDAKLRTWSCVSTCNNGAYDQRWLPNGTLVCIPC